MDSHRRHIYIQPVHKQVRNILEKSNTKFSKICLSWMKLTQWRPFLPKEGGMIQVDIGGPPPIRFGPTTSILVAFHFQQLTIFSRLSGPPLPEPFWGLNDPSGYWWPPTYSIWTPPPVLSVFKLQQNLLFLATFWVLNFRSRFHGMKFIPKVVVLG